MDISAAHTSKSLSAAKTKATLIVSMHTTSEYASSFDTSGALWSPATSLAFLLPSNLASKTKWYGICLYPSGIGSFSSKTMNVLCFSSEPISLPSASSHRWSLLKLSRRFA